MQFITLEDDFSKKCVNIFWVSDCMWVVLGKKKKEQIRWKELIWFGAVVRDRFLIFLRFIYIVLFWGLINVLHWAFQSSVF